MFNASFYSLSLKYRLYKCGMAPLYLFALYRLALLRHAQRPLS